VTVYNGNEFVFYLRLLCNFGSGRMDDDDGRIGVM